MRESEWSATVLAGEGALASGGDCRGGISRAEGQGKSQEDPRRGSSARTNEHEDYSSTGWVRRSSRKRSGPRPPTAPARADETFYHSRQRHISRRSDLPATSGHLPDNLVPYDLFSNQDPGGHMGGWEESSVRLTLSFVGPCR